MNAPKITLRRIGPSPALTAAIEEIVAKLEARFPRKMHCEVLLEAPTRHHRHGAAFAARVDLSIPGAVVVGHAREEDAYVAVKLAFLAARRQLANTVARRRERAHGT